MAEVDLPEGLTGKVIGKAETSDARVETPEGLSGTVVGNVHGEGPGIYGSFFGKFNKALLALPDNAINAVMMGLEKTGVIDTPPPESYDHRDYLRRVFNAGNMEQKQKLFEFLGEWSPNIGTAGNREPQSFGEKLAGAAGENVAMSVPVLGAQALATKGTTFAGNTANNLIDQRWRNAMEKAAPILDDAGNVVRGPVAQPLLEKSRATAQQLVRDQVQGLTEGGAKVLAGEVAAAAGSGALGQAEEELTGRRTGIGDMVGGMPAAAAGVAAGAGWSLLKKVSPSAMALNWVGEKAAPAINMVANRFKDPNKEVRGVLGEQLDVAYQKAKESGNLQRTQEIEQAFRDAGIEPPKYTPAEATLDNVLQVGQVAVQSRGTGEFSRQNVDRINTNKESIRSFVDSLGSDDEAPSVVVSALQKHQNDLQKGFTTELDDIEIAQRELKSALPQVERRDTEGATIRYALKKAKEEKMAELQRYADSEGINDSRMSADITELRAALDNRFTKGDFTDKYIPKPVQDLLNSDDPTLGFQSYLRYRNEIGDEIGKALANNQDSRARSLVEVKKTIDDWAENGFKNYPGFAKFRERYETEYALPFERGVAYEVLQTTSNNPRSVRYLTSDEKVAQAFSRNVESAGDFMRLFQGDEAAQKSMRNVILDAARDSSMGSPNGAYAGTLDPYKLESFITKNREVLTDLGLKEYLSDINSMAGAVASRNANLESRMKAVKQDELNKLLVKLGTGDMDPDQLIDLAIKKPGQMNRIAKRIEEIGDPHLSEALKAAVVSRVLANGDIDNPQTFLQTINKNKKSLTAVLGPEHFKNMEIATDAMLRAQFAQAGAEGAGVGALTSAQIFEQKAGVSLPAAARLFLTIEEGRLAPQTAAFFIASRMLSQRQRNTFDELFRRTMTDPDLAKSMAQRVDEATGEPTGPVQRRIKAFMFNIGRAGDSPENKEPEKVNIDSSGNSAPTNEITIRPQKGSGVQTQPAPPPPPLPVSPPESSQKPPAPLSPGRQGALPAGGIGSLAQQTPAPTPGASPRAPEYASLFPRDELGAAIAGRP